MQLKLNYVKLIEKNQSKIITKAPRKLLTLNKKRFPEVKTLLNRCKSKNNSNSFSRSNANIFLSFIFLYLLSGFFLDSAEVVSQ